MLSSRPGRVWCAAKHQSDGAAGLRGDRTPFPVHFYPPAEYQKISLTAMREQERFFSGIRIMLQQGYLEIADASFSNKKKTTAKESGDQNADNVSEEEKDTFDEELIALMKQIKKEPKLI